METYYKSNSDENLFEIHNNSQLCVSSRDLVYLDGTVVICTDQMSSEDSDNMMGIVLSANSDQKLQYLFQRH